MTKSPLFFFSQEKTRFQGEAGIMTFWFSNLGVDPGGIPPIIKKEFLAAFESQETFFQELDSHIALELSRRISTSYTNPPSQVFLFCSKVARTISL